MQSTSWKTLGWLKHKLESRLPGEISITPDMQMTPPLWRKWRTKEPLDEVKEESEKVGLKLKIQKTKIMASSPITSWQIDRKTVEIVAEFRWWLQPWNKKMLTPWKKVMTNLDSILKSRHHFTDKGTFCQSCGFFPVIIYRCESWTIKKAECRRIDAFEL